MNVLPIQVTPDAVIIPRAYMPTGEAWEVVEQEDVFIVRRQPTRFDTSPNRAAMLREVAAFEAQHAGLVTTHLGRYVAFHNGRLCDSDTDRRALRQRIRAQLPTAVVLIRRVEAQLPSPLRAPAPRFVE